MNLRLHPFSDKQPRRILKLMYQASQKFGASVLVDCLCSLLDVLDGFEMNLLPDYTTSTRKSFTKFTMKLAETSGSLNFLSLGS